MCTLTERFLRYVSYETTSDEDSATSPSTAGQLVLARALADEMRELGLEDVAVSEFGIVTGTLPAVGEGTETAPTLGLIAHMDTSPAASGREIHPRILKYEGGDIDLTADGSVKLTPENSPQLMNQIGHQLIVTDGTTLLGADDKAGIAEIMSVCEYFLAHPEVRHGKIRVAFTPDEEIGHGVDHFDVEGFGADIAYTVDGGRLGEIEYENFNAATAVVTVHGLSVHTGSAKNRMINAIRVAMEYSDMLPAAEIPEHTELREGFFHIRKIEGGVEKCTMTFNIRDHGKEEFAARKAFMERIAAYLNQKYGDGTVELKITDTSGNMREIVEQHMELIDYAMEAFRKNGIEPETPPIRGGTDGARLSFMGLPCPNLSTGGYNYHGRLEYASLDEMKKMVDVLRDLAVSFV
ncbi:MAG: peptidase T [Bacillota bacterium]|nr:peptidase T [Bacillota bacterium]